MAITGDVAGVSVRSGIVATGRWWRPRAAQPAPVFADLVMVGFLLCLGLLAAWRVVARSTQAWQLLAGLGYLAALVAVQLWFFRRPRSVPVAGSLLLVQAVLVTLPCLHFSWWLGLPGVLVGSVLLVLPAWAAVPLAGALVVAVGGYGGSTPFAAVFDSVTTLMTGLAVYGLTRLAELVYRLHQARGELAQLAVAGERLRFTRELQLRLELRLSAIAAHTEQIRQMDFDSGAKGIERVRHELGDVLETSRRALADARSVAARLGSELTGVVRSCPQPAVSRRLVNAVVIAVLLCFGAIILADVLVNRRDVAQAAAGAACLAVVLGLQAGWFAREVAGSHPALSVAALGLQALFACLPVAQFGGLWLTLLSFVAANALLVLPAVASAPVALAALATVGWVHSAESPSLLATVGQLVWAVTGVVVIYGLTRLARLVGELNEARAELARMAVAEERLRFARDVHDLLGLSLSAVTLKAELATRLLDGQPEAARGQLAEIVELSRRAIGDVRSVVGGYREFRLAEELSSARSVLSSAEIDVRITGDDVEIPDSQSAVLATVAREGVTNVLRHSAAGRCEISVLKVYDGIRMEIVNDGLPAAPAAPDEHGGGNGIRNLLHRVREVGGELAVGVEPNGTYRLLATVPLAG